MSRSRVREWGWAAFPAAPLVAVLPAAVLQAVVLPAVAPLAVVPRAAVPLAAALPVVVRQAVFPPKAEVRDTGKACWRKAVQKPAER